MSPHLIGITERVGKNRATNAVDDQWCIAKYRAHGDLPNLIIATSSKRVASFWVDIAKLLMKPIRQVSSGGEDGVPPGDDDFC